MRSRRASPSPRRRSRWRRRRRWCAEFPGLPRADASVRKCRRNQLFAWSFIPSCRDYTGIYEHYRPAGPQDAAGPLRSTSPTARPRCWRRPRSVAVFCPTSNLFIGSGLFDRERLMKARRAHRGGDRYRRRHQLFDAAHAGRGLQGAAAARPAADAAQFILHDDAGQCPGAVAGGHDRRDCAGCAADLVVLDARRDAADGAADGRRSTVWPRSCSCCRRWATTGPSPRSMLPGKAAKSALTGLAAGAA